MKCFLNGAGMVAVMAIAGPVLAQAPTPGAAPAPAATFQLAQATTAPPPMAHPPSAPRKHRPTHGGRSAPRGMASSGGSASPGDNVANQLNRQELQRLDTGPAPAVRAMPTPGMPGAAEEGPKVSGGGYIAPSRPGPVSAAPGAAEEGPKVSGGGYIRAQTGPMPMPPPPPTAVRPSGH
jgi:hypothetical protein